MRALLNKLNINKISALDKQLPLRGCQSWHWLQWQSDYTGAETETRLFVTFASKLILVQL
jgi:hypothetical protein